MLFMTHWTVPQENLKVAIQRFKETGAAPPKGVKMIGRWHDVGQRGGITISEADDAEAIARWSLQWSDLLTLETHPVFDDAGLAKVLAQ
jgi:Domain of unknown function (DUF3303)